MRVTASRIAGLQALLQAENPNGDGIGGVKLEEILPDKS